MKPYISIIASPAQIETPKRVALNKWQFAEVFRRQDRKCPLCGVKLYADRCEDDHIIPLACGGTHDLSNRQLLCIPCHSSKTNTKDKGDAAKIKRMSGEKGQAARRAKNGSKMKSRGFDKTISRKFSGEVVRKDQSNERE